MKCICEELKGTGYISTTLTANRYRQIDIEKDKHNYYLVAYGEMPVRAIIYYCPKCGRKLEEDD